MGGSMHHTLYSAGLTSDAIAPLPLGVLYLVGITMCSVLFRRDLWCTLKALFISRGAHPQICPWLPNILTTSPTFQINIRRIWPHSHFQYLNHAYTKPERISLQVLICSIHSTILQRKWFTNFCDDWDDSFSLYLLGSLSSSVSSHILIFSTWIFWELGNFEKRKTARLKFKF